MRVIGLSDFTTTSFRFATLPIRVIQRGSSVFARIVLVTYPMHDTLSNPLATFSILNSPFSFVMTPVTNEESVSLSNSTFAKEIAHSSLSTTFP